MNKEHDAVASRAAQRQTSLNDLSYINFRVLAFDSGHAGPNTNVVVDPQEFPAIFCENSLRAEKRGEQFRHDFNCGQVTCGLR
jgi:hypothetical protein